MRKSTHVERDSQKRRLPIRVLQCGAVCCSVLQCVAVCCGLLQRVAACCSVLHTCKKRLTKEASLYTFVAVCCSVLQCVAVCCSVCYTHVTHVKNDSQKRCNPILVLTDVYMYNNISKKKRFSQYMYSETYICKMIPQKRPDVYESLTANARLE